MFLKLLPFLLIFVRESYDKPETPLSPCWQETESSPLDPFDLYDKDDSTEEKSLFFSYLQKIKSIKKVIPTLTSFFSHNDKNYGTETKPILPLHSQAAQKVEAKLSPQPLSFYVREAKSLEEEIPLLYSSHHHDDENYETENESFLYPHAQAIKRIEYECGLIPAAKNIYFKKKTQETHSTGSGKAEHEKIIRDSKNSQILMCKSAMENTKDLQSIFHYKKIMENIHQHPGNDAQRDINNLYSFHRMRILSKRT